MSLEKSRWIFPLRASHFPAGKPENALAFCTAKDQELLAHLANRPPRPAACAGFRCCLGVREDEGIKDEGIKDEGMYKKFIWKWVCV